MAAPVARNRVAHRWVTGLSEVTLRIPRVPSASLIGAVCSEQDCSERCGTLNGGEASNSAALHPARTQTARYRGSAMNFETGDSLVRIRAQDAEPRLRAVCTETGSSSGALD